MQPRLGTGQNSTQLPSWRISFPKPPKTPSTPQLPTTPLTSSPFPATVTAHLHYCTWSPCSPQLSILNTGAWIGLLNEGRLCHVSAQNSPRASHLTQKRSSEPHTGHRSPQTLSSCYPLTSVPPLLVIPLPQSRWASSVVRIPFPHMFLILCSTGSSLSSGLCSDVASSTRPSG